MFIHMGHFYFPFVPVTESNDEQCATLTPTPTPVPPSELCTSCH